MWKKSSQPASHFVFSIKYLLYIKIKEKYRLLRRFSGFSGCFNHCQCTATKWPSENPTSKHRTQTTRNRNAKAKGYGNGLKVNIAVISTKSSHAWHEI